MVNNAKVAKLARNAENTQNAKMAEIANLQNCKNYIFFKLLKNINMKIARIAKNVTLVTRPSLFLKF